MALVCGIFDHGHLLLWPVGLRFIMFSALVSRFLNAIHCHAPERFVFYTTAKQAALAGESFGAPLLI